MNIKKIFPIALLTFSSITIAGGENGKLSLTADKSIRGKGIISKVIDAEVVQIKYLSLETFEEIIKVSNTRKKLNNLFIDNKSINVRIANIVKDKKTEEEAYEYLKSWVTPGLNATFYCFEHSFMGEMICTVNVEGHDIGYRMILEGYSKYIKKYGVNPYYDEEYTLAEEEYLKNGKGNKDF